MVWKGAEKSYRDAQDKSGIKVGDKVKVMRKAERGEQGWGMPWIPEMDAYVGLTYTVYRIDPGLGVKLDPESAWFPYFVLQKIGLPPLKIKVNGEYRRIILDG